jgi:hypothetical protein
MGALFGTCESCRFFRQRPDDVLGACHRYPPTEQTSEMWVKVSLFPKIHKDDWCGEFKLSPREGS